MQQEHAGRFAAQAWRVVETLTAICFVVTLLVMFVQVTSRYALGIAVPWTEEASRFSFIVAIFLGAALCQKNHLQIRITVLLDVLPARARRTLEAISDVLTILIAAALIVGAVEMAISSWNVSAATLPMSFGWLYVLQCIGLVLVVLVAARNTLDRFSAAQGKVSR